MGRKSTPVWGFVVVCLLMGSSGVSAQGQGWSARQWQLIVSPTSERLHIGVMGPSDAIGCAYLVDINGSRYEFVNTDYDLFRDDYGDTLWGQCTADLEALGVTAWPPEPRVQVVVHALVITEEGASFALSRQLSMHDPLSGFAGVQALWEAAGVLFLGSESTPEVTENTTVRFGRVGEISVSIKEGFFPRYQRGYQGGPPSSDSTRCDCLSTENCRICGQNHIIQLYSQEDTELPQMQAIWEAGYPPAPATP